MRARRVVFAILMLVAAVEAGAQGTGCRPQGALHVCEAVGFGTIFGQDIAQARDEALLDAQRRALEQVGGVQLDAETVLRDQAIFDQLIRTQTRGLIESHVVLEEGAVGDGRYRVKIVASVKAGEAQDRLKSLLSELSLVVLIPEENMGQPQAQPIVENAVVSRLLESGFRVLDQAQVQRVAARDQLAALLRGDGPTAREIGLKFLSNVIVVGQASARFSQNNQGIVSAHARVTARVIEAETGRVLANVSLDRERGFARNEVAAGEDALAKAGPLAADRLLDALRRYYGVNERRIEVRLRGLPSVEEYHRAKDFLQALRWVSDVAEGRYSADESVLVLTYPAKTLYLTSRIEQEPQYRVVEAGANRILIQYRRGGR